MRGDHHAERDRGRLARRVGLRPERLRLHGAALSSVIPAKAGIHPNACVYAGGSRPTGNDSSNAPCEQEPAPARLAGTSITHHSMTWEHDHADDEEKTMNTKHISRRFRRFKRANEAVSALEYALLIGVIATLIAGALVVFGGKITAALVTVGAEVTEAAGEVTIDPAHAVQQS